MRRNTRASLVRSNAQNKRRRSPRAKLNVATLNDLLMNQVTTQAPSVAKLLATHLGLPMNFQIVNMPIDVGERDETIVCSKIDRSWLGDMVIPM
jgi:hypothetical protein